MSSSMYASVLGQHPCQQQGTPQRSSSQGFATTVPPQLLLMSTSAGWLLSLSLGTRKCCATNFLDPFLMFHNLYCVLSPTQSC